MSLLCTKSPFAFNKIKSPPVPTGLCDLAPAHFSNVILSSVFIPPNAHSALLGFKDTHIFFLRQGFVLPVPLLESLLDHSVPSLKNGMPPTLILSYCPV